MEFLVNLYIHRDNQLRGKKDEESDFIDAKEIIQKGITDFLKIITNLFKKGENK